MNENFKKNFGARIRYLRKLSGLSQEKLAEKAGLSAKTISYIEHGKNTISFNKLPLLAEALDVSVYKLFIFTDTETFDKSFEDILESANIKEINAIKDIIKIILALH